MVTVVSFIIVLGIMIFFHEFGHFIVAKRGGIKVIEFAFGFGPKLFGVQKGETLYSLRLLPLGGFCRLLNEAELEMDLEDGKLTPEEYTALYPRAFERKSYGRRLGVFAAGSFMNFVLGLLLFVIIFAVFGIGMASDSNVIGTVVADFPAAKAGLTAGDKILSINGEPTPTWTDVSMKTNAGQGQALILQVERANGEIQEMTLVPELDEQTGRTIIGIRPTITTQKVSIIKAVQYGLQQTADFTSLIVVTLVQMITGRIPADIGGPVAVAQVIGEGARAGMSTLMSMTAVLSIQFGILNLFPIPGLDGGQIVVLTYEKIRRKKMNPEIKGAIQLTGLTLLMLLMVAVTFNDIMRIFR